VTAIVDIADRFRAGVEASIATKRALLDDVGACIAVAKLLIETYRNDGTILLFGNGGSAADAQHIAAEFVGRFYLERRPLPAHALTVNSSIVTAIANDYGYELVFARQVEAMGRPGDVAVGLSTSGNAPSVIAGFKAARRLGLLTVAMTGASGGLARAEVDHCISVPSVDVPRIQEAHLMIGHIWSELVEAELFGDAAIHNSLP
jgi:D-sedoheptulose 7-phosphate isomerase